MQDAAKELLKYFAGLEKYERRSEVVSARRHRFYWRDVQYIFIKRQAPMFSTAAGAMNTGSSSTGVDQPRYTEVFNIFTPIGEIIIAALTQNPPGVNFQPDDQIDPKDIASAAAAEKYKNNIDRANKRKELQSSVARLFYTDGRTILRTRKKKGAKDTDAAEITSWGVLETKLPITAKCREECVYVIITDDPDVNLMKSEHPDYADQIKAGPNAIGESAYERFMRLGVLQGTQTGQAGDAFNHLATRQEIFFRYGAFEQISDQVLKQEFKDTFPAGLMCKFVGGVYVDSETLEPDPDDPKVQLMDKQLAIGFPLPGDGMNRSALGKRVVPLQDYFNDGMNTAKEGHDYCIPLTYQVAGSMDIDAIRWQRSEPGNNEPIELPPGIASAADCFFEQVADGIPASLPEFLEMIQGPLLEFITGALPSLQGAPDAENQTKGGRQMARDQALGRLGLPWGAIQELFAEAYGQAAWCAAKSMPGGQQISYSEKGKRGKQITGQIDTDTLKAGNFGCYPDTDSNFPETIGSKRNTLMAMVAEAAVNPVMARNMAEPDNQRLLHEINGIPEFKVMGEEASDKQLEEIEQLLKESPIPPSQAEMQQAMEKHELMAQIAQQAQASGQKVPPLPPAPQFPTPEQITAKGFDWTTNPDMLKMAKPSIDVDPEMDFHDDEWNTGQLWYSSQARRDEEDKGNRLGVLNVRLHLLKHNALRQPPQPIMPPPKKGGKSGGPAPMVPPPTTDTPPAAQPAMAGG